MIERWFEVSLGFFLAMDLFEVRTGDASISLPKPSFDGKISVEKAINKRNTVRDFTEKGLSLGQKKEPFPSCRKGLIEYSTLTLQKFTKTYGRMGGKSLKAATSDRSRGSDIPPVQEFTLGELRNAN